MTTQNPWRFRSDKTLVVGRWENRAHQPLLLASRGSNCSETHGLAAKLEHYLNTVFSCLNKAACLFLTQTLRDDRSDCGTVSEVGGYDFKCEPRWEDGDWKSWMHVPHFQRSRDECGNAVSLQGAFPFRLALSRRKAWPHQLYTAWKEDHLDFAEDLIDGTQLLPKQPSPSCSHGEGWKNCEFYNSTKPLALCRALPQSSI